jgi:hypothetical protein
MLKTNTKKKYHITRTLRDLPADGRANSPSRDDFIYQNASRHHNDGHQHVWQRHQKTYL